MPSLSFPYRVLALGPFASQGKDHPFQEPIRIEPNGLDQVIERLALSLSIPLAPDLYQWDRLPVRIKGIKGFHPDHLIEKQSSLKTLLEARKFVEEAKAKALPEEEVYGRLKAWPDLPMKIRFEQKKKREEVSTSVDHILEMVTMPGEERSSPGGAQPFATQITRVLQQILTSIFSDVAFRNLESVWQGLQFLMKMKGKDTDISFEIVPVTLDTLEETLDFLTPSLVENLPALILLDLPFEHSQRSLDLLEKVALFSETLLTPCLCWISPRFLHLNHWNEIGKLPFLPHYFDESAFAKWRRLKALPSAKWMVLTCNRFLIRYPYGPENRLKWVQFDENDLLWISPVWAMAGLILQSHAKTGWPTRFTEWENIRLTDLALHPIEGDRAIPTETNFSEERIDQLIRSGLLPLVTSLNKDFSFVPRESTAGGSFLSYQLFLSRVTHFLFWCKDQFEKDLEPPLLEQRLKKAFSLFWEKTGNILPRGFEVSAKRAKPENPVQVRIMIDPSRQMLPSGERVEFDLNW